MKRIFKGIWIPKKVWLDKRLTCFEKAVYAEIDSLDGEGGCFASNQYLAGFFGCTERHIRRALAHLSELGYIKTKMFDGRKRVIKICGTFSESTVENFPHFVENKGDKNVLADKNVPSEGTGMSPQRGQECPPRNSYSIDYNIAYISSSDDDDKNKVVAEREKIKKSFYGCFFSEEQEEDLCDRLSLEELDHYCKKLADWKRKNHGGTYRSDYKIILKWVKEDRKLEE